MTRKLYFAAAAALALTLAGPAGAEQPLVSTLPAKGPKPWTAAPTPAPDTIRFAIIGDNTGLARPGIFDAAMRQIGWMNPEMIMSVGDLVEGYTEDQSEIATEWKAIEASVAKASAPFFYVPGNHDLGNDTALAHWRQTKGAPYYAFIYKDALFLVLDSEDPPKPLPDQAAFRAFLKQYQSDPVGFAKSQALDLAKVNEARDKAKTDDWMTELNKSRFSDAQVAFVADALKKFDKVRWTFVFMHKPGWKADDGNFPKIEALLANRPYTAFAGHYHYYEREIRNGRDYIAMGTTGGSNHQEGSGKMDHIAWVSLEGAEPDIALVKLNGLLDRTGKSGQADGVF